MTTVRDMIRKKGYQVFSIAPDATVLDTLSMMAEHNIGALLVMSEGEMVADIVAVIGSLDIVLGEIDR